MSLFPRPLRFWTALLLLGYWCALEAAPAAAGLAPSQTVGAAAYSRAQDLAAVERALENRKLNSEIKRLKEILNERYDFANIIARSGKMRAIPARTALITSPIPSKAQASRSWSVLMIRVVIGTPRSARISASSSSSQSIGLPLNCCARDCRKFIDLLL